MNEKSAIEYIHSVNWQFCKPGLDRIEKLCECLGNPQDSLKFIHVAGTNGKGSFSSMLDCVLRRAGYKVGLFTSPYILEFNERMRVDGKNISGDDLATIVEYVKEYADKMQDKPTEFELITAIGFEFFKRQNCDVVILECGMGGRLDSTNIVNHVLLSTITGISLDHTAFLGDTVEKIALEKAGIIKENTPVLFCGDHDGARDIIYSVAKEKGSKLYTPTRDVKIKERSLEATVFDCGELENISIRLLGSYQPKNARNVITACDILKDLGMNISDENIRDGLFDAVWHARFEVIGENPTFIFDGGHNPEGVSAAVESIKEYLLDEKVCVVTGVMADKDYEFIADRISEIACKVYTVTPNNPRALNAKEYAEVYRKRGIEAEGYESLDVAVYDALAYAKENGKTVLSLGSLYMYCEVIEAIGKQN